jgi:parvulin-like peptidyl-prolyl isomerase
MSARSPLALRTRSVMQAAGLVTGLVGFAGVVACEPPASTTPVTIGDKIPAKHGAAAAPGDTPKSPGEDQLGKAPEGLPSPHGSHGDPGTVGPAFGSSTLAKAAKDAVVVTIDGTPSTKADLDRAMAQAAALAGIPPDMLDDQMRQAFEQPAYEKLIERALLVKEAKRRNLWPDEAESKQKREEMIKTLPAGKNLGDVLAALGADEKSFAEDLRVDIAIGKLLQAVEKTVPQTPQAAIDSIYEQNKSVFSVPDTAAAAHILIKADRASGPAVLAEKKKLAQAIKAEVMGKDQATFAKVAAEKSEDGTGKARGGDLGVFKRGDLFPEFEEAAFKMKEGDIVGPIQTDRGFHIIRSGGVTKGKVLPAKEAKGIIAERERVKAFLSAVDDLVEGLRKGSTIVRVIEPSPSPLVDPNERGSRVPSWRATGKNALRGVQSPHGTGPSMKMPPMPKLPMAPTSPTPPVGNTP